MPGFSDRSLIALAMFGLTVRDVGLDEGSREQSGVRVRRLAERVLGVLGERQVAVVVGASGAGKSTLLRAIEEIARCDGCGGRAIRVVRVEPVAPDPERPDDRVIDVVSAGGPVDEPR